MNCTTGLSCACTAKVVVSKADASKAFSFIPFSCFYEIGLNTWFSRQVNSNRVSKLPTGHLVGVATGLATLVNNRRIR
jgi:hypothetical protein